MPSAPPGLLRRVLPPPPPPTPTTSNTQVPTTPNTSPPKRLILPHMDMPTPPEKDEPAKKKQRSNIVSRKSMEGERRVTRSATLTSLQVTSQSALEDDEANAVVKDAFGAVKMVSSSDLNISTEFNLETLPGPTERDVMQFSNTTLPISCIEPKKYDMLNLVQKARTGRPKFKSYKNGNFPPLLILLTIYLLCLTQTASTMSYRVSTLSIFALNANGLVHPGKIAHVNTAINTRRPHLFVFL